MDRKDLDNAELGVELEEELHGNFSPGSVIGSKD